MVKIKSFQFGPFGTNTYVVSNAETGSCILIDCAAFDEVERDQLCRYLTSNHLTPDLLVCTHGHLDHVWGAQWACQRWGLTAYIHEADFRQIEHLALQQENFGLLPRETDFPYRALSDVVFRVHHAPFRVLHTPGHTQGCVCLYCEEEQILFSGDTLFDGGYGRTDLPGGNYMQLMESLDRLTKTIPSGTTVYPGHGPHFQL